MLDPDSKPCFVGFFFFTSALKCFTEHLEQNGEIVESLEMSVLEHFAEHPVCGHKHTIQ